MSKLNAGNGRSGLDGRDRAIGPDDHVGSEAENVPADSVADEIVGQDAEALEQFNIRVEEAAPSCFDVCLASAGNQDVILELAFDSADLQVEFFRRLKREFGNDIRGEVRGRQRRASIVKFGASRAGIQNRVQTGRKRNGSTAPRASDILFRAI